MWGLETVLVLSLGMGTALAADPADDSPLKPTGPGNGSFINTLDRWFGSHEKPAPKKPKIDAVQKTAEKPEAPAPKPTVADQAAAEREREMQALIRRQMVCLKLMQVAAENHDEELQRKAEQLDERARDIYAQRTAHLPCCKNAGFESDEQTLEKHLGPTDTAAGRSAERPAQRQAAGKPASQARGPEELP
jgi:hypothetical protein